MSNMISYSHFRVHSLPFYIKSNTTSVGLTILKQKKKLGQTILKREMLRSHSLTHSLTHSN